MARDLGLFKALRQLDWIPTGPALAAGLGLGAVFGFAWLRDAGSARIAGFIALVAAAAALAISARPVAAPPGEAASTGEHPTLKARLKAALIGRVMLPALLVAVLLVNVLWNVSKGRAPRTMPSMPAPSDEAALTAPRR